MEPWLILTIIAAIGAAVSSFIDNYLTDDFFKERTPQAQKCFYGPLYCIISAVILVIYFSTNTFHSLPIFQLLLIFLSGVISSISSISYYSALETENTTGAAIFMQLSPVFYLILGVIFLGERIQGIQLIAFLIILAAPLTIILSARRRGKKLEYRAAFFLLIYILIYSFSSILFVFAERGLDEQGFQLPIIVALAILLAGKGLFDIVLSIFMKKWRRRAKQVMKESKKKVLVPIVVNSAIWVLTDYFTRSALVLGQVAVVSAVCNVVQLISTFALGLIFTIVWPRFGREKLDKRTVLVHATAIVLAIIGVFLVENPEMFVGG